MGAAVLASGAVHVDRSGFMRRRRVSLRTQVRKTASGPKTRRTRAELDALDSRILAILRADHPQSIRHAFYRLVSDGAVPKTDPGYRAVVRRCTELRRAGRLPYRWLVDSTRRGYHVSFFEGAGDLIERFAGLYRVNVWLDADCYVEVWTESRSIAGVVEANCRSLGVSLYPAGGFASLSLAYQAAEGIRRAADGRPVRIVYVGDYDPAGVLIDRSVMGELRGHLPGLDIEEVRVAITAEQAAELPSKPRKAGDKRRPDIASTVEAEAMPAGELRAMLRATVESFMPAGALAAARPVEESERDGLRALAALVDRSGIAGAVEALGGTP